MAMRDKIEHAIQNQPCTVKDLKNKFGGDRGADRKVMEAVDQLVHGHGSEGENILWQCAIKLSTRSRISRAP